MDPREIAQIITDALRRHGLSAEVRSVDISVPSNDFLSIGGRRSGRTYGQSSPNYEMTLDLVIDARSMEESRAREEYERRQMLSAAMNPVGVGFAEPMTNQQIGDYFRDGHIPEPTNTVYPHFQKAKRPPQLRSKNGKFTARPRVAHVDVFALARSLRMPVAFIDVFALVRMLVDITEYCGDALVRWSLLEYK